MKKIDVSNPLVLAKILAQEGLTNQIPADASLISEPYNASQDVGFPAITMKPVSSGGEAPDGKDFNGFLNLLSSHLFALQNGGVYTFNQDVSTAIGGYPQGALLSYAENGNISLVLSLIDDNTYDYNNDPSFIDGEKWVKLITYTDTGATVSTPSNSDNSTKIINSEWFNNKWQEVNALPATFDPDVFYYIKEEDNP